MGIKRIVVDWKQNLPILILSILFSFAVSVSFSNPSFHKFEIVLDIAWILFIFMVLKLILDRKK